MVHDNRCQERHAESDILATSGTQIVFLTYSSSSLSAIKVTDITFLFSFMARVPADAAVRIAGSGAVAAPPNIDHLLAGCDAKVTLIFVGMGPGEGSGRVLTTPFSADSPDLPPDTLSKVDPLRFGDRSGAPLLLVDL